MVGFFLNLASPVVPDLTTVVGNRRSPSGVVLPLSSSGTAALVAWYYRWGGTAAGWSQYYRCMPSSFFFLPRFDPCCFVWWLMLFSFVCFVWSCVWFQVMIILSSRSAVSTLGLQHQSATAALSQQVVPLVLNRHQQAHPQVLHHHLSSRRDPPTSQRERL